MKERVVHLVIGLLTILALGGGILVASWDHVFIGTFSWKMWITALIVCALTIRYWLLRFDRGQEKQRDSSWRRQISLAAALTLLLYLTQSLWISPLVPVVRWLARSQNLGPTIRHQAWTFVSRPALQTRDPEALSVLASDSSAPGDLRAKAWVAMAHQSEDSGHLSQAGDCYLSALDSLISTPDLPDGGYILRNEVWEKLRFKLGSVVDRQRYRTVLAMWMERSTDQQLSEQLAFELGKLKVLASLESHSDRAEVNR